LLLADVDDSNFHEPKLYQGVVGAAPAAIDRDTKLQRFDYTWGRT